MSTKKITFTVKSIDESGPLILTIESAELETKEGKKAVEKIFFAIPPSERGDLKNILESKKSDGTENKEFELAYDDEDLEVEEGPEMMASMSSDSGPNKHGPEKKKMHLLSADKKELRIWELNLITLTVKGEQQNDNQNNIGKDQNQSGDQTKKKSGDTDKQALIDKYIKEIKAKLQAAGITTEQEIEILGNVWENTYKAMGATGSKEEEIEGFKTERIEAIDDWIAKNKKGQDDQQNQTPKGPTKEQIDEAAEKLKNAKSEEELAEALKKTRDIANNSSDEELKRQKEEKEIELGKRNKQKVQEIIRDEVNGVLDENGIKPEDLSTEVKQKYDELNNNNNNNIETSQAQTIRTEIFNDMGEKALEKLIATLEQAIKNKNKNEVESQSKKLQEFVNSQVDYKKSAYEKKGDEVQRLLDQAKNYSTQNSQNNEGFFRPNNPLMWVSGVAVVGIVAGAILIVRSRKRKAVE
ncbi:protein of unknown function [endosymbiont DhMRE of Dentiscutata heterogama]|uniref:hypothetical protein n=1 Tax=endosymbiont DhMRE of Dentiscutata heterogama TaxID=1609546 RepID=UPI000629D89F|nr:hypothetical protein [endosymbiont DhMRE of Dentiscutata heterogama]CFW92835.1 protein of unknown function [endosymbiont DhMRE of Dentiscutata heterogama]